MRAGAVSAGRVACAAVGARRPYGPVLLLAWLLTACGESRAPESIALRPGDGLLQELGVARVLTAPRSNLDDAVAARLGELLGGGRVEIPADRWVAGEPLPPGSEYAVLIGTREEIQRWSVRPSVGLDLAVGVLWLEHEGRHTRRLWDQPGAEQTASRTILLQDEEAAMIFYWEPEGALLRAFGARPPGDVAFGYRPGGAVDLGRFERELSGLPPVGDRAEPLRQRVALDHSERLALAAPAPTTVEFPDVLLLASALDVELSVLEIGFRVQGDRILRVPGASDGVLFAVEIVRPNGTVRRIWERYVLPGEHFVADTVDLARWTGKLLSLRLVTEGGRLEDTSGDYALWSGLRLRGEDPWLPERPHIVVVDVDTLRADRLGIYGAERETSPRIDAWANGEAVVFTDSVSVNDWTLPATVSMLTGLSVSQHGVVEFPQSITDALEPVAARLAAAGYETRGRSDGGFVVPAFGFGRGFERFDYARRTRDEHQRIGWTPELEQIRAVARTSERPLFLFLQTYQVHTPYPEDLRFEDPARPYDGPLAGHAVSKQTVMDVVSASGRPLDDADVRYLRDLYDAGVRRMDDVVGAFLEALDDAFDGQPYAVIFVSDHGDELYERGGAGHGHSLHRELLRVPLVVRFPDGAPGRRDAPVSLLDVAPTILDLAGLPIPEHWAGRSLAGELQDDHLRVAQHRHQRLAALWNGYKLMRRGRGDTPQLYRHADDPFERRDLATTDPERTAALSERLDAFLEQHPRVAGDAAESDTVDAALVEELQALGYLGDG